MMISEHTHTRTHPTTPPPKANGNPSLIASDNVRTSCGDGQLVVQDIRKCFPERLDQRLPVLSHSSHDTYTNRGMSASLGCRRGQPFRGTSVRWLRDPREETAWLGLAAIVTRGTGATLSNIACATHPIVCRTRQSISDEERGKERIVSTQSLSQFRVWMRMCQRPHPYQTLLKLHPERRSSARHHCTLRTPSHHRPHQNTHHTTSDSMLSMIKDRSPMRETYV